MKAYIYILIISALALCSCVSDLTEMQGSGDGCLSLTVMSSTMSTRADSNGDTFVPTPGEGSEDLITRLDIYLYPEGGTDRECLFYKPVRDLDKLSSVEVKVYVPEDVANDLFPGKATACDVFVVANLPEEISLTGKETVAELQQMYVSSQEFAQVVAADGSFVSPQHFVMSSLCKAVKTEEKIEGTVSLERAAAKVTMTITVPEYISVKVVDQYGVDRGTEIWSPYFNGTPQAGIQMMHMGFHKGLMKTIVSGENVYDARNVFETQYTERFNFVKESTKTEGSGDSQVTRKYYEYKCDVSYYTYALDWTEDADNDLKAPYFTLMLPWTRVKTIGADGVETVDGSVVSEGDSQYQTYYYQVVLNGRSKKVSRNTWYDINLTVGVLGSRVLNEPTVLDDMSCYVLDWSEGTNGLEEGVDLQEWQYLVVHDHRVEMNNVDVGSMAFDASHKIAWTLHWPGSMEGLDDLEKYNADRSDPYSAYYIDCSGTTPKAVKIDWLNHNSFSLSSDGETLDLHHSIPADKNIYSPIYVHLMVWLDVNPNGTVDKDEEGFVEYVTFVQYPPIYIIPDKSASKSVFVNGYNNYPNSNSAISYNGGKYVLAWCPGTGDSEYMHIVNVSSFNAGDTFTYKGEKVNYLIGDPRQADNNVELNDDGFKMSQNGWATDGQSRRLTYYYPTATQGEVYRVISPSFRIASSLGGYSSGCTPEGAAMRCASYQEHGLPAGRWRLPTTAEIMYVISLQSKGVIQNLFYGSNYYYSSTGQVQNNSGTVNYRDTDWQSTNFTGSVRCVYDEWYWGGNREAKENSKYSGGYEFTWGDKERKITVK